MLDSSLEAVLPKGGVVTDVVPRGGGRSAVYEVRLAGADPVIVKQYDDRWLQTKEVYVYGLLASHGVGPLPRVLRVDAERAVTVLTLVPGGPLSSAALFSGRVRAAYRRMGELLGALHRIAMPAFGFVTTEILSPQPENVVYMRGQFARHLATFAAHGGPADLHAAIQVRVDEQGALLASCTEAVLCHNDLHEGNVLVDEAGVVTGFIDVENVVAADPMLDLAKTLQYDRDRSPVKRAALFDGYGPLPRDAVARIDLYRMFHSLELWAFFAEIGNSGPLPSIAEDIRELVQPI